MAELQLLLLFILACTLEISGSVDNAAGMASMLTPLNDHQRRVALTYGLGGSFIIRGLTLLTATVLIGSVWVQALAGLYLIYVMAANLEVNSYRIHDLLQDSEKVELTRRQMARVVVNIELLNFTMSIDQLSSVVALTRSMPVLLGATLVGMVSIRFGMTKIVPIFERRVYLKNWAFLLVGAIGVQMLIKSLLEADLGEAFDVGAIALIIALGTLYEWWLLRRGANHWVVATVRLIGLKLNQAAELPGGALAPLARISGYFRSNVDESVHQQRQKNAWQGVGLLVLAGLVAASYVTQEFWISIILLIGSALTGLAFFFNYRRKRDN